MKITLNQIQTDGSLFRIPLQLSIEFPGNKQPLMKTVEVNEKSNVFTIGVESAPEKIVPDPNSWVLTDVAFEKK